MSEQTESVLVAPNDPGVDIRQHLAEITDLYREDAIPWVVGYSGGKDSTAVLQLVWKALQELEPSERTKPVHVISTDTLVENPIVAAWVTQSLETMRASAREQGLPIEPHRLMPKITDTFWVNLIGRGYPSPRPKFRWCTERLKINPSNQFIRDVVRASGEALLVLGSRKAESATRARHFNEQDKGRIRDRIRRNAKLPNSLVYDAPGQTRRRTPADVTSGWQGSHPHPRSRHHVRPSPREAHHPLEGQSLRRRWRRRGHRWQSPVPARPWDHGNEAGSWSEQPSRLGIAAAEVASEPVPLGFVSSAEDSLNSAYFPFSGPSSTGMSSGATHTTPPFRHVATGLLACL